MTRAVLSTLLALAVAGAAAPTPSALSKDDLLDRWATALGGRARLASLHSVHLVARIAVGSKKGRFETWYTARSQRRDLLEVPGVLHQEIVFDGNHAWVWGPSGKVRKLSGADLEDQVTSAYQATYAWLVPGRLAGDVKLSDAHFERPGYALAIRPENGGPYVVFLDARTFLPTRMEQRERDHATTQTLSDWRAVGGINFPWRAEQRSSDSKLVLEFSVESIELDPTIGPQVFRAPVNE
jgi:hypothetical protein